MQMMTMTEARARAQFAKQHADSQEIITLYRLSNLNGKSKGTMSLTLPMASELVSFYVEQTELDEAVMDAVDEVTNMISGQARKGLVGMGMIFIPPVITGGRAPHLALFDQRDPGHFIETKYGLLMVAVCFS